MEFLLPATRLFWSANPTLYWSAFYKEIFFCLIQCVTCHFLFAFVWLFAYFYGLLVCLLGGF